MYFQTSTWLHYLGLPLLFVGGSKASVLDPFDGVFGRSDLAALLRLPHFNACLFVCSVNPPARYVTGDIDDEYLEELENSGRGANRRRAGRRASLVTV